MSILKQNDDIRPGIEQQNITNNLNKDVEQKAESVQDHTDEDMNSDYDSSQGNGGSSYDGDGGKKRKQKEEDPDGTVMIKGRGNVRFDMKI